ncbi:ABC-F family ATP-binding cassette domain-containing protein [Marinibactrum halimedae]|uniref:Probable ATP-binding protein YheS n=1 Tax=Marinibactrum halimedae TaxID=1444977 RepID=A0AA37WPC7_9GAMM|nr:ATP-binding cassette domain-containing protein [Marinibactrum halimedae]MCD9458277.1 ATP-binding cassette domain-containing protein [Marinibactrum halimedae]GLS27096.1 ABC transporter ATP-binding protein [Marinibactrum halimedae]
MITLNELSLQRGTKPLLEETSLRIYPGHKIGVIGANGCGKSSLFKLLLGQLQPDGGHCDIPNDWRIAHMAQEVDGSERSALDYVIDGDTELRNIENAIAEDDGSNGERLGQLYAQLETIDGYNASVRAEQLLQGLGFTNQDYQKPVNSFSGGWRIRLNLAQALMRPSELLLLDEPTNHLDLDTTVWLEQWLQRYQGTLLLISHDRDFLDQVISEVVNIEQRELVLYAGNYSSYERQKAERLSQQQQAFEKQQRRINEIENFVRRFRAKATKAKQAQSRLKELQRMEAIAPAHIDSPFQFSIPCTEKMSTPLVRLDNGVLGYDQTPLLSTVNISITPETRLGLLGANGAGKSTLIKCIAESTGLLSGERVCGEHLHIGYFNQHQLEALDMDASCALHLQRLSPNATEQSIRNFLGGFDFHGDRALEPIRPFSGGEKARLALAIIAWQQPNLLLLDEPTNHLDLEMRHALTVALQAYAGAVVIISHDRHLLRNTVTDFVLVDAGKVEVFDGTLEDYQRWLSQRNADAKNVLNTHSETPSTAEETPPKAVEKIDRKSQRQAAAALREKLKPLTNRVKKLETAMGQLASRKNELETALADETLYANPEQKAQLQALLKEQADVVQQLEEAEEEWLEVTDTLEALHAENAE